MRLTPAENRAQPNRISPSGVTTLVIRVGLVLALVSLGMISKARSGERGENHVPGREAASESSKRLVAPDTSAIELLGTATFASDALDRSGLNGLMQDVAPPMPHARLGSLGSGICYTGREDLYFAIADRGPKDGAVKYLNRFHTIRLRVDLNDLRVPVFAELVDTHLLRDADGVVHTGKATAYADRSRPTTTERRLDPEAIVIAPPYGTHGPTIYTSEEYGPWIDRWTLTGERLERIQPPEKFLPYPRHDMDPDHPEQQLPPHTVSGRQPNRGFEGLAISPDGARLTAMLQGPLLQDGALDHNGKRIGVFVRILDFDRAAPAHAGTAREWVYQLDNRAHGVNEILAVGPRRFLVLEKDGKEGTRATARRIYLIDTSVATDIGTIQSLPSSPPLPAGVRPVEKRLLFDMLEPRFGLSGPEMPEKVEGLALGPDLPDGRKLLIVSSDNDFRSVPSGCEPATSDGQRQLDQPTRFWAFAIDPSLLD